MGQPRATFLLTSCQRLPRGMLTSCPATNPPCHLVTDFFEDRRYLLADFLKLLPAGVLAELSPEEAVALLSALVFQEKSDVAPELPPALAAATVQIHALFSSSASLGSDAGDFLTKSVLSCQLNPETYTLDRHLMHPQEHLAAIARGGRGAGGGGAAAATGRVRALRAQVRLGSGVLQKLTSRTASRALPYRRRLQTQPLLHIFKLVRQPVRGASRW